MGRRLGGSQIEGRVRTSGRALGGASEFQGGASERRGLGFGTRASGLLQSPPDREAWLRPAEFLPPPGPLASRTRRQ